MLVATSATPRRTCCSISVCFSKPRSSISLGSSAASSALLAFAWKIAFRRLKKLIVTPSLMGRGLRAYANEATGRKAVGGRAKGKGGYPPAVSPQGRLAVVILALVAALALAGSALGQVDPSALQQTDVAIESGAQVSDDDREALEDSASELSRAGTPTKYVVLEARPSDPAAYARSVRQAVGAEWTVLVLSPSNLRIDSPLPTSAEQAAFEEERDTLQDDPIEGTIAVAERLSEAAGSPVADGSSDGDGDGSSNGLVGLAIIGGLVIVGGGGALLLSRRSQKRRLEQSAAADRAALDPMVDGLAAQIADLDQDMELGGERALAAKEDYAAAALAYSEAREVLALPSPTPAQVDTAGDLLEKGLRAARRARARLDGRPVEEAEEEPLLQGLCTFNPQHGKAVTSVSVAGPDGEQAEIPTCQECADRMNEGRQPDYREVETAAGPGALLADGADGRRGHRRPAHRWGAAGDPPRRDDGRRAGARLPRWRLGRRRGRRLRRRRRLGRRRRVRRGRRLRGRRGLLTARPLGLSGEGGI